MRKETITITTEYIKLDQILKFAGLALMGAEAKELIASGKVSVNGEVCLARGKKLRPGDRAVLEGEAELLVS